ncbi:unnamed protein product [Ilex paraguariensis]|uniref:pyruvate decarboxylase n=1 Tax=Ilex paraguariensis TaxID=185542 RepID=A0ABC8TZB1_9AQUA
MGLLWVCFDEAEVARMMGVRVPNAIWIHWLVCGCNSWLCTGCTDVIACIGDASRYVTAQDVSTMLRCGQRTIIFLINNGPLEEELIEAIKTATNAKKDCLCFIEVFAHKDDTSKALLEWGSRVSAANSRPPNPQ